MHVQIITFNLKGLSDEEYRSHCEAIAPAFAQLPGLLSKTWLANAETRSFPVVEEASGITTNLGGAYGFGSGSRLVHAQAKPALLEA